MKDSAAGFVRARPAWLTGLALAALISGAASAQPAPDTLGTVSTYASATRRLPNTAAEVTVAIEVHSRTLPGVTADLAKRAKGVLGYLAAQSAERLRTNDVALQPETQSVRNGPDRIVGYTGRTSVSFRVAPDALSDVLAGCLDHGADTIQAVQFTPREEELEAARRELATEATRDAMAQARAVTEAAGQHLVRVKTIDVQAPAMPGPMQMDGMAPMLRAARPVAALPAAAGDAPVTVTVAIQVRIDG